MDAALAWILAFVRDWARATAAAVQIRDQTALTEEQWWAIAGPLLDQVLGPQEFPLAVGWAPPRDGRTALRGKRTMHSSSALLGSWTDWPRCSNADGATTLLPVRRACVPSRWVEIGRRGPALSETR